MIVSTKLSLENWLFKFRSFKIQEVKIMIQDSAIVSTGMGDRGTSIGIEPTESAQVSFKLSVMWMFT